MTSEIQHVDGVRFRESGPPAGPGVPTFLLLHGLGGSLHQWNEIQQQTSTRWRTIAVDIPGFGQEAAQTPDFSVESASRQLATFCQSLQLRDCTLVSHSIGSVIAGMLARQLENMFPRFVLISGALFRASAIAQRPTRAFKSPRLGMAVAAQFLVGMLPVRDGVRRLLARSPAMRRVALWPFVADPAGLDGHALETGLTGVGSPAVLKVLLNADSIDFVRIIASVRQPVGFLWGAEDRLIGAEDIETLSKAVNLVQFQKIEDCGHWPMLEKPDAVIGFLENWGQDAPPTDQKLGRL